MESNTHNAYVRRDRVKTVGRQSVLWVISTDCHSLMPDA